MARSKVVYARTEDAVAAGGIDYIYIYTHVDEGYLVCKSLQGLEVLGQDNGPVQESQPAYGASRNPLSNLRWPSIESAGSGHATRNL